MNLVSYSLYGQNQIYIKGLFRNIEIISDLLHDYLPIVYIDSSVPTSVVRDLQRLSCQIRYSKPDWHENGMFWRFTAFFEDGADRVLIRDADSKISEREVEAVREWEKSEKNVHIMRDHPLHTGLVLGGMWAGRSDFMKQIIKSKDFKKYTSAKGQDQLYLASIYLSMKKHVLSHDSFFKYELNSRKFPTKRLNGEFIGEVLNINADPLDILSRKMLINIEKHKLKKIVYSVKETLKMKIYILSLMVDNANR